MRKACLVIAALCLSAVVDQSVGQTTTTTTTRQGTSPTFAVPETKVTQYVKSDAGLLDEVAKKVDQVALATSLGGTSASADATRAANTDLYNGIGDTFANKATALQKAYNDQSLPDCTTIVNDLVGILGDPPKATSALPLQYDPLAKIAKDAQTAINAAGGAFDPAAPAIKKLIDALNLAARHTDVLKPLLEAWLSGLDGDLNGALAKIRLEADQIKSNPVAGTLDSVVSKAAYIQQQQAKNPPASYGTSLDELKANIKKYIYALSDLSPQYRTLIQAWNPIEAERTDMGDPKAITPLMQTLQGVMNNLKTIPDLADRIAGIQPFWDKANAAVNGDQGKDTITVPATNQALIDLGNKILGILPVNVKAEFDLDPSRGPHSKPGSSLLKDVGQLNENQVADDPNLTNQDLDRIEADLKALAKDPKYAAKIPILNDDLKKARDAVAADKARQPPNGLSDATYAAIKQLTRDAFGLGLPNADGTSGSDPISDWFNLWLQRLLKIIRDVKALNAIVVAGGPKVKQNILAPKQEFENDVAVIAYVLRPTLDRFSNNILDPFRRVFGGILYEQGLRSRKLTQAFTNEVGNLRSTVIGEALLAVKDLRAEEATRRAKAAKPAADKAGGK